MVLGVIKINNSTVSILDQINTQPNKLYRLDNFCTNQSEIKSFINDINNYKAGCYIISGDTGFGVTHLINAACNYLNNKGKVIYVTSQWLIQILKTCKSDKALYLLREEFIAYDLIAIDNTQVLYRKALMYQQFIIDLIERCKTEHKWLILGNSDQKKDFTRSKKNIGLIKLKRIELKELSSLDVFTGLRSLCSLEDRIPDNLLYAISGYNGSFSQHVNCLIAIRFKSRIQGLDIIKMTHEELIQAFDIGSYFQRQQFRKCFKQIELRFIIPTQVTWANPAARMPFRDTKVYS